MRNTSLVIGYWLLVIGYWLLVIDYLRFTIYDPRATSHERQATSKYLPAYKAVGPAGPGTVPRCGFRRRTRLWRTSTDMKCLFISAPGRFMFAFWQTYGYFNTFSNNNQLKTAKNALFLVILFPIEIRTISRVISLKRAELLALAGIVGFSP